MKLWMKSCTTMAWYGQIVAQLAFYTGFEVISTVSKRTRMLVSSLTS